MLDDLLYHIGGKLSRFFEAGGQRPKYSTTARKILSKRVIAFSQIRAIIVSG
jgi:hypothetical protein